MEFRRVTGAAMVNAPRAAVRCAWVRGRLVGYSRALRGILYAKQGGDDRARWSPPGRALPDPCTRSVCIPPLPMSGRPTLAQPPLRPVTPAVRLLFRRCEDVDDLAVPKPSSYHFTLRRRTPACCNCPSTSVVVRWQSMRSVTRAGLFGSRRVASKAILSFQQMGRSVASCEVCSYIRV